LPTGVCWVERLGRYYAHIQINGKIKYLGLYNTVKTASDAYQNELKKLGESFIYLNNNNNGISAYG